MNEQILFAVRSLPRHRLEGLAVRVMMELRDNRRESSRDIYFLAVLSGFVLGVTVASTGFVLGTLLG